jgi:hypothetical protein
MTLTPFEVRILSLPGWHLRLWLAITIAVALAMLPLSIAGLALWAMSVRYMMLTETAAHVLGEYRRTTLRLEIERDENAARLVERDIRIAALEADLMKARSNPYTRQETDAEKIHRQVGLHPRAPAFLVVAARRAFRSALHPDRHPQHRSEAQDRYLKAEAAFERIAELRK